MKSILAQDGQGKAGQQPRVTWKDGQDGLGKLIHIKIKV